MKCSKIHKNLIFYLDNELPAEKMELIRNHIDQCSDCSQFFLEMKTTLDLIKTEPKPAVNPFFYTRLKAQLENQRNTSTGLNWQSVFQKVLQPAIFSILLLIGVYSGLSIGQSDSVKTGYNTRTNQELIPYLNEMGNEPIESFLMD